jgi:hypothetical protein
MPNLLAMPFTVDPFPAALSNLISRARAATLVASEIEAAKANLLAAQADLNSITAEIARVKQTILSEETAAETEGHSGIAPEDAAVAAEDLRRLSQKVDETRTEVRRLQNLTDAERQRCEKLAKDVTKKALG